VLSVRKIQNILTISAMTTQISFENSRKAFGEIVRQYQNMVPAVTFRMAGQKRRFP